MDAVGLLGAATSNAIGMEEYRYAKPLPLGTLSEII